KRVNASCVAYELPKVIDIPREQENVCCCKRNVPLASQARETLGRRRSQGDRFLDHNRCARRECPFYCSLVIPRSVGDNNCTQASREGPRQSREQFDALGQSTCLRPDSH